MNDIQQLIQCDKEAFLALNGSDSTFWDGFMWIYTSTLIWIPLALVLLYVIIRNNKLKEALFIIIMIAITVVICDRISSGVFKPIFKRFRPAQDPEFMYLVDIVNGYRGGKYGFISSHAANTFGLITFTSLLFRKREFTFGFLLWAIISCYSRIYLGVHYLGDVICGAILGVISGFLIFYLYKYLDNRYIRDNRIRYSRKYTSSGYLVSNVNILLIALFTTIFIIMIVGMLIYHYSYL
ncbi:phosphatase PAP2 family protein [uncultured Bacteroides sp.]|uniref:phosphatase PAP2 family protein n=1 Tax=uncultured Bacteroides sp. TaxID=162156 RepID=UPI00374945CC